MVIIFSSSPDNRLCPFFTSCGSNSPSKPFPDVHLHAASQMGYAPENCVVIEDSVAGVKAGSAAGMRVLGYAPRDRHSSHHEALIAAGAKLVFDDMSQLLDLLKV